MCPATRIGSTAGSTIALWQKDERRNRGARPRSRPGKTIASAVFGLIAKRLLLAIPNLIGVVIITFLLTHALPGDPAAYFAGPAATKEAIAQVSHKLGLDRPLIVQFGRYVSDLAHGDLGTSLTTGQPVLTEIKNRLPASA